MHPLTQVWWTWNAHAVCTANGRIFSSTKKASWQNDANLAETRSAKTRVTETRSAKTRSANFQTMICSTKNCAENLKKWNPWTSSKTKKAKPTKCAFLCREYAQENVKKHFISASAINASSDPGMVNVTCTLCLHSKDQDLFVDKKGKLTKRCQPCRDKICEDKSNRDNIHVEKHISEFPDDDILNKKLCGKCKKMKPMDHFKNKKGETYKMCLSCRDYAKVNNKEHYISTSALNFGDKNIDLWECRVCHNPYPHFEFVGSSKTCTLCTADAKSRNLERELQCPHETCMYRGHTEDLRNHVRYMHHAANAEIMICPDCPYSTQKPSLFKKHRWYCTGDLNVSARELAIMRVLNQYAFSMITTHDTRLRAPGVLGYVGISTYTTMASTILSNLTGSNITYTPHNFMVISRMDYLKGKKSTTK